MIILNVLISNRNTRFKLKRQKKRKKHKKPITLHAPWRWIWSEGCYQQERAQGRSKNLLLGGTKADGTENVVQHPHTTNSQEQRGLIQNRRQRLGWAGCRTHLSSSPGSNTHSFSLCFSLDPTDLLANVGKLSACYLPWQFCQVSFAQHHKHDPCWSQEGPDAHLHTPGRYPSSRQWSL